MDFSRFTFSSRIAIYEAISLAKRHSHSQVLPLHLAIALTQLKSLRHQHSYDIPALTRILNALPKSFGQQPEGSAGDSSSRSPRYSARLMSLFRDLLDSHDPTEDISEHALLEQLGDLCPELSEPDSILGYSDSAQGEVGGFSESRFEREGSSNSATHASSSSSDEMSADKSREALRKILELFSDKAETAKDADARASRGSNEHRPQNTSRRNSYQSSHGKAPSSGASTAAAPKKQGKANSALQSFTADLTLMAAEGAFDPIGFRDSEMWRLREVLGRKKKNNPILLGEPGVGKTAIVEGLAQKLVAEESPKRLVALDLGALMAGARYRGDLEGRVQSLVNELKSHSDHVVLFIDEVHMLLGAGGKEGQGDLANYLKPALASGELQCIGATTYAEYQQIIEKDPALSRRFQPIVVKEPAAAECLAILRGLKDSYETYHQITIADDALVAAVELSERYLPLRHLPDKAIDLLDEACSLVKLQTEQEPREIATLRSQVEQMELESAQARSAALQGDEFRRQSQSERNRQAVIVEVKLQKAREQLTYWLNVLRRYHDLCEARISEGRILQELRGQYETALKQQDFALAAKLNHEDIRLQEQRVHSIMVDVQRLELGHPSIAHTVSSGHVRQILHRWTGIPLSSLQLANPSLKGQPQQSSNRLDVRGLGAFLRKRLLGQGQAISAVVKTLTRSALGLTPKDQPLGVFMLVGATGLGKTHLAKLLAEYLYGDSRRLLRFDMGEFQEAHSVARLLGSPPGYVGHESVGKLTQELRRYPFSVLLIDEIEKAHPQVLDVFLRLFDEGQITDSSGRQLDFTNGVVLLTSNALTLPSAPSAASGETVVQETRQREDRLRLALKSVFRPEFVNRIDDVVLFQPLSEEIFSQLVQLRLERCNEDLARRQLRLELAPALVARLAEQAALSDDGARALERLFVSLVLDPLAERLAYCGSLFVGWWRYDGRSWQPAYKPESLLAAPAALPNSRADSPSE